MEGDTSYESQYMTRDDRRQDNSRNGDNRQHEKRGGADSKKNEGFIATAYNKITGVASSLYEGFREKTAGYTIYIVICLIVLFIIIYFFASKKEWFSSKDEFDMLVDFINNA